MSQIALDENHPVVANDAQPYEVRITTHGKMSSWVAFALDFLDVGGCTFFPYLSNPNGRAEKRNASSHISHPSGKFRLVLLRCEKVRTRERTET
jgi:hypothetical protein